MGLPNEKEVERCIHYLAETDERFANLKASMSALEYGIKIAESLGYLEADGPQEQRKAKARAHQRYKDAVDAYENAKADFHLVENKRTRAITEIDVWRSVNANQRRS